MWVLLHRCLEQLSQVCLQTGNRLAFRIQACSWQQKHSFTDTYHTCAAPSVPQELSHQDIIRQLKLEHGKEVTKLRQEFELQVCYLSCYVRLFLGLLPLLSH